MGIPIVVLSGLTDSLLIERALECGASDYIVKPFNLDGWLRLAEHLKQMVEDYRRGGKASSA
jgi:PleD family two-component response regulator